MQERHGADAGYAARLGPRLTGVCDRVLDNANLQRHAVVADIGTGDGLLAFSAIAREPSLELVFVDISPALIAHAREAAQQRGLARHARFVVASTEAMHEIADASVDRVMLRAVLAYVPAKLQALRECFRILRPGGRISLVDPIFQDRAFALAGFAAQRQERSDCGATRYLTLLHRIGRAQLPDTLEAIRADPLTNYNERDLLRHLETAGFSPCHLRLHVDAEPLPPVPWDVYLRTSLRAGTPTVAEILAAHFSPAERLEYERYARPGIETGSNTERAVNAYLFADKPAGD